MHSLKDAVGLWVADGCWAAGDAIRPKYFLKLWGSDLTAIVVYASEGSWIATKPRSVESSCNGFWLLVRYHCDFKPT